MALAVLERPSNLEQRRDPHRQLRHDDLADEQFRDFEVIARKNADPATADIHDHAAQIEMGAVRRLSGPV
jgi:hypothetical protein